MVQIRAELKEKNDYDMKLRMKQRYGINASLQNKMHPLCTIEAY